MILPSIKRIREVINYDIESGVFTWVKPPRGRAKKGAIAGSAGQNGYLYICIDGARFLAHRLAWMYINCEYPAVKIDHINGKKHDNRIVNLRLATDRVNAQNVQAAQKNNSSGFLGVSFCKFTKRWKAQITSGKNFNLGRFDTPELASAAYLSAKRQMHEGCTI